MARLAVLLLLTIRLAEAQAATAGESPAPLSARGRANLEAFARLAARVRFFHPSDGVAAADWNRWVVAQVEAVEAAADQTALASRLSAILVPLAPTVQVFLAGSEPPAPHPTLATPADRSALRIVAWRHYGVAFRDRKPWSSERVDDRTPLGFANLEQWLPAVPLAGRRVRLAARVQAELAAGGRAELWLRAEGAGGEILHFARQGERPIAEPGWARQELVTEVPAAAQTLTVGLVLTGGGTVRLDDVVLEALAGGTSAELVNARFEEGDPGRQPPGWTFPYASVRAGYRLALARGPECLAGGCAEIVADALATPRFPAPAEAEVVELGSGVLARVPHTLWADALGTLPRASSPPPIATASGRAERLAAAILAWGVLEHFYPYREEVGAGWREALGRALEEAAVAAEPAAFRRALRRMLANLGDGLSAVGGPPENGPLPEPTHRLPVEWEWIEGRLVITAVGAGALAPGDVVRELDGRPADQVLGEAEALTAGASLVARRAKALEELAWGPEGAVRRLGLERTDGGSADLGLAFTRPFEAPVPASSAPVFEPRPGVLYLDLRRLDDEALAGLMPRLEAARGLIFDARGPINVGTVILSHLARREVLSPNWHIPVQMEPGAVRYLTTLWTISPRLPRLAARAAFLTDARATGFTETFLCLVEAGGLGRIVGAATAGANSTPNRIDLPGGWRVVFTGMKVTKRDGSPLHGVGVLPAVPASRTLAGVRAGRDEVLEAALAAIE